MTNQIGATGAIPGQNITNSGAEPLRPAFPPTVPRASARPRHIGIFVSYVVMVLAPLIVAGWYLYTRAADQYASRTGFAVRSEEMQSTQDLLGGLGRSLSGANSSDTDILYEFIQSQDIVERINADLDLVAIFARPENDPVFAYQPTGRIEDLTTYWQRMVRINYDTNTGLIELRVTAFDPDEARAIARAIVRHSTQVINDLSAIARSDLTRYAREDLDIAVDRLKSARGALTQFRSRTRIVDPKADVQGQMGLLNSLESQLAEAVIEMNLLRRTSRAADPRIEQASRRIEVIRELIEQERQKFGIGSGPVAGGQDYSTLIGTFERLSVDVEYAERSYIAAQNALDTAQAEAQRQSRYLATYLKPTLAQSPRYPERLKLMVLLGLFLFITWAISVLIFYALRDRR